MGIINITPDSFYSKSRVTENSTIIQQAEKMLFDGATILDIGGQSTRPGSTYLSADEELQRIIPAVKALCKKFPSAIISIDTFYSKVAKAAVEEGCTIVNDISAGEMDSEMFATVSSLKVPYILMHMQENPSTMQKNPTYKNVTDEVCQFLKIKIDTAEKAGIKELIIDPGFGFGKTIEHNFQLLKNLSNFKKLGKPILAGLSRKSMINKLLNIEPEEALNGTTALNMLALMKGASILRVHDVKEAKQTIQLFSAVQQ